MKSLRGFESNYGSMLSKDSHSSQPETGPVAESPAAASKIRSRLKWALYATAAIAVLVAAKYFHVQSFFQQVLDWISKLGPWGPVIFVGIYIVATVFFIPGSVLTLGAGAVFGLGLGSVCVSISATLGATAAFLVGRYLARDAIARKIEKNEKFAAIDRAVGVRLGQYVLASWIGMMPGTVMYVYLGSLVNVGTGHRQRTTGEWVLYGVGLLATIAVTIFVTRVARKTLQKKITSAETLRNPQSL